MASATTKAAGRGRLPSFIVIGAMRCGTTALHSYLREHPEVAVGSSKELHFFDAHWDRGLEWYRRQFEHATNAVAVGEATPTYICSAAAISRIRETLPGVNLIAMLRNPVDRAHSHYWHDRSRGKIDLPFSEAIERELADDTVASTAYVDRGRYRGQLEVVLESFPAASLHVQAFEDMRAEPDRVFSEVCGFIGVDSAFRPSGLGKPVNAYAEFRSLKLRNMARRLPKLLQNAVGRVNRKEAVDYPPMEASLRRRLNGVFSDANAGLEELIGRSLPDWS